MSPAESTLKLVPFLDALVSPAKIIVIDRFHYVRLLFRPLFLNNIKHILEYFG